MPDITSLESLRSRFRSNGGPANLSADEQSRLLNHHREMGLTETEVQTLRTAYQLGGKTPLAE
jgi:hypothetical protein